MDSHWRSFICRLGISHMSCTLSFNWNLFTATSSCVFSPVYNAAFLLAWPLAFRALSACSSDSPLFLSEMMMEQCCLGTLSYAHNGNYQSVLYVHLHTQRRKLSFTADNINWWQVVLVGVWFRWKLDFVYAFNADKLPLYIPLKLRWSERYLNLGWYVLVFRSWHWSAYRIIFGFWRLSLLMSLAPNEFTQTSPSVESWLVQSESDPQDWGWAAGQNANPLPSA